MTTAKTDSKILVLDMNDAEFNRIPRKDAKFLIDCGTATMIAIDPMIIKLTREMTPNEQIKVKKSAGESGIRLLGEHEELSIMGKLSKDLMTATTTLTDREARYLVDSYYQQQDNRMRADGQVRSMSADEEPHLLLEFFGDQARATEDQMRRALDAYSLSRADGRWAREVTGVGPVLAAGLLANIDITKAPTVSHIWRYAGLDPTVEWKDKEKAKAWIKQELEKPGMNLDVMFLHYAAAKWGRSAETLIRMATTDHKTGEEKKLTLDGAAAALARRPWNASLKTLCWKIGESFVKVKGNKNDVYGKLYEQRKAYEQQKNERGEYAEKAALILASKNFSADTKAKEAYLAGRLPDGHLHARAKRWAVKLFLAHLHDVMYREHFKMPPPAPYPIAHQGHAHMIEVPYLKAA
jgi:hypothetical protein